MGKNLPYDVGLFDGGYDLDFVCAFATSLNVYTLKLWEKNACRESKRFGTAIVGQ